MKSHRWALPALSSSLLLASLDTSIANTALPVLARGFHASFQCVQWVILSYLLAITSLIVSAGRLGDLFGRRRLLLIGIAGFTLASAACGLAPTLPALLAARAIQGLAAAVMIALSLAFVGEVVPKEKTGRAMGLLGTTSAIGTALGPSLGGALVAAVDWRAIFFVNVPIGLLAALLAWRSLPADAPRVTMSHAGIDKTGTLVLGLTLCSYALSMTLGRGHFGTTNLLLLALALGGAALFTFLESRAANPLVSLELFRKPAIGRGFTMSALISTVVMSTLVVGPFYLSESLGLSAAATGLALSCGPLVAAVTGIPAGRIVDRIGSRRTTIGGISAMLAGASILAVLSTRLGVAGYIAPIATLTAGYALFQAANNTSVMKDAGAEQRGVVSGVLNLSRNLGLITGASLMGAVFAFGSSVDRPRAAAIAAGLNMTFGFAALLMVAALVLATRTDRKVCATALCATADEAH
jgi:EmrB/QacA subfamily drug resistance transporter